MYPRLHYLGGKEGLGCAWSRGPAALRPVPYTASRLYGRGAVPALGEAGGEGDEGRRGVCHRAAGREGDQEEEHVDFVGREPCEVQRPTRCVADGGQHGTRASTYPLECRRSGKNGQSF